MIRLVIFFAILFAVALGASWIADRPGTLLIDWQGYQIETSVMVAVLSVAALVVVCLILWSLLRGVVGSPGTLRRFFSRRRRERGTNALKRGFIAIGAGNLRDAQREAREARKLLRNDPAVRLLTAQSAQLAGDRDTARKTFEAMLEDEDTKLLGLHGLYIEAKRQDEGTAARHYVEEAAKLAPATPWAGKAKLEFRSADGDWEGALKTLEANAANKLVDKKAARRLRAVLLTARGLELEDGEPDSARKMAVEAHGLAPDLVPAATLAGRLLSRNGDYRKGAKILETAWKKDPHPEIAEAYLYLRPGDSARDRMKRARTLNDLRPNNPEGALALARVAIDLRDFPAAREALTRVLRSAPSERACLMMADVEEGEHGDQGRMREWLARAVRMPRDPAWIADGYVSDHWAPVSPVSGRLDAFEWKVPVAMLGGDKGPVIEEDLLTPRAPITIAPVVASATPAATSSPAGSAPTTSPSATAGETAGKPVATEGPTTDGAQAGDTDGTTDTPKAGTDTTPASKPTPQVEIIEPGKPLAPTDAAGAAKTQEHKTAATPETASAKAPEKTPEKTPQGTTTGTESASVPPEASKPASATVEDKDFSGLPFGGRAPDDPGPHHDEPPRHAPSPRY